MNYYIADLHFGHNNVIRFDNRPFHDVEHMKFELIRRWNERVTNDDTVYILGDFCWGKASDWKELTPGLKGSKVLIRGNHDLRNMPSDVRNLFADVKDYKEIRDNGRLVIMSHYPIPCYKRDYDPNVYMLHGHVHETQEMYYINSVVEYMRENSGGKYIGNVFNVGCMTQTMDYTPKTLDEIIKGARG